MTLTDGGLATTLQARGLPPFTPVDDWLLTRPDDVEAVHREFVQAGAGLLLTGTFRALPELQPRWEPITDRALDVAHRASGGAAEVWGSIGPASTTAQPWPSGRPAGWRELGTRLTGRSTGLVLETFVDPEEASAALSAVRDLAPVVVLLTVRPDGKLYDGTSAAPALTRLLEGGAHAVGVGCGEPAGVLAVVKAWDGPPLWARPGRCVATEEEWFACAVGLASRCAVLGGCCGVSPALIAALSRALRGVDA